MSRDRASRRLPVVITLIVGLMLTIMPLPESAEAFRPDWLALLLIFWAMQLPRTWSVGTAWMIGIVLLPQISSFSLMLSLLSVVALFWQFNVSTPWLDQVTCSTSDPPLPDTKHFSGYSLTERAMAFQTEANVISPL